MTPHLNSTFKPDSLKKPISLDHLHEGGTWVKVPYWTPTAPVGETGKGKTGVEKALI